MKKNLVVMLFSTLAVSSAFAIGSGNGSMHQKMAQACQGKVAGDVVSITGKNGQTRTAVCRLVAVPTPPAEAVNACAGKAEGDKVSFTVTRNNNARTVTGVCVNRFDQLVARPDRTGMMRGYMHKRGQGDWQRPAMSSPAAPAITPQK